MMKKLLTTFAVLTMMTAFAMAQGEPIINSGTITNKGIIKVSCTVAGESILNEANGVIANNATGLIQFTGANPMFYHTTGGTGSVTNAGTIRFDGNITQDVMTGLGTALADRIGGTVIYNGALGQIVQGETYYTNLSLASGGAKTFTNAEDYYVSAAYTAAGGDRTYNSSVFHYDGDVAQTIFPEGDAFAGGVNFYNDLELHGSGMKTIATGQTVRVKTKFEELVTATTTNDLEMQDGSVLSFDININADVSGAVLVTGGKIIMEGAGHFDVATTGTVTFEGTSPLFEMNGGEVTNSGAMTFNTGTYQQNVATSLSTHLGTLTLAGGDYNQTTGNVRLAGTTNITNSASVYTQTAGLVTIEGTTTISAGTLDINGTNATNDLVTISAGGTLALSNVLGLIDMAASSNMLVNGAFTSAATANLTFNETSTVTYDAGTGILATTGANPFGNLVLMTSPKTHVRDIYVDGTFTLSDADLAMGSNKLAMTDATKSATIEPIFEVVGRMARSINSQTSALTFNNSATTVAITTNANHLDTLTLNVVPGDVTFGNYQPGEDIKRSIAYDYQGTATDWVSTVNYGYKLTELPGTPATGFDEDLLRYREVLTPNPGGTSEKVSTGSDPLRTNASGATWGQVTLAGIIPGDNIGSLAEVLDGNQLFLRGTPTVFYTINDGRWSNPGTWDEGRQPASSDSAVVLHTVHVGFRRTGVDGNSLAGQIPELNVAGLTGLARQIRVTSGAGASLLFGDRSASANTDEDNLTWETALSASLIIQNNAAQGFTNFDQTDLGTFVANSTDYNGLIIFGNTGGTTLSLKANQLINRGQVGIGEKATFEACLAP